MSVSKNEHNACIALKAMAVNSGELYSEGVLRAAQRQMARLSALLARARDQARDEPALDGSLDVRIDDLLRSIEQAGITNSVDEQIDRLNAGVVACEQVINGRADKSSGRRFQVDDALIILLACERNGFVFNAMPHCLAHTALVNGQWDASELMKVGPLPADRYEAQLAIDAHYLGESFALFFDNQFKPAQEKRPRLIQ